MPEIGLSELSLPSSLSTFPTHINVKIQSCPSKVPPDTINPTINNVLDKKNIIICQGDNFVKNQTQYCCPKNFQLCSVNNSEYKCLPTATTMFGNYIPL